MNTIFHVRNISTMQIEELLDTAIKRRKSSTDNLTHESLLAPAYVSLHSYALGSNQSLTDFLDADWGAKPPMDTVYESYYPLEEAGLEMEIVLKYTSSGSKLIIRVDTDSMEDDYENAFVTIGFRGSRESFQEDMKSLNVTSDNVENILSYVTGGPDDMTMWDTKASYIIRKQATDGE